MIKQRKVTEAHAILHALDNDIRRRMVKILSNRSYSFAELQMCMGLSIHPHLEVLVINEIVIKETAPDGQYKFYTNTFKMNIINKAIKKFTDK